MNKEIFPFDITVDKNVDEWNMPKHFNVCLPVYIYNIIV